MCDCDKQTETKQKPSKPSRRKFLKATGAVVVSASMQPFVANAGKHTTTTLDTTSDPIQISNDDLEIILATARKSSPIAEALDDLQKMGLVFDLSVKFVKRAESSDKYGKLSGIVIKQANSPSQRLGSDFLITFNPRTQKILAYQYIIGWCYIDRIHIWSQTFDATVEWVRVPHSDRTPIDTKKGFKAFIRSSKLQQYVSSQPDFSPLSFVSEEPSENGWPIEQKDRCYWYFRGCSLTSWVKDKDMVLYRCDEISEYKSCDINRQFLVPLNIAADEHIRPNQPTR